MSQSLYKIKNKRIKTVHPCSNIQKKNNLLKDENNSKTYINLKDRK